MSKGCQAIFPAWGRNPLACNQQEEYHLFDCVLTGLGADKTARANNGKDLKAGDVCCIPCTSSAVFQDNPTIRWDPPPLTRG